MNFLSYSLQAAIGLSLMYAFYRAFLVRLTFYRANRFYLAGYSVLCLLVPFVNTSGLWPHPIERSIFYIQAIPKVIPTGLGPVINHVADTSATHAPSVNQVLLWLLLTGTAIMCIRLGIQVLSLARLRRKAVLLEDTPAVGISVFALPYPMAPFSFGRSIFVHPSVRNMPDFPRILDHEQAHIHQYHTLDILLTQVVLLLQWWNPIAWMLQRSIRQNLEFLADQSVIDQGVELRQYQYLLLHMSGFGVPGLSNPFNFSPLKNRIAMMNKQRSHRRQVVRFLFALPLLLLLLVAASRHQPRHAGNPDTFHVVGFILDASSLKLLAGATVVDDVSGMRTTTDDKGYFGFDFPIRNLADTLRISLHVEKAGYSNTEFGSAVTFTSRDGKTSIRAGDLRFIGLSADHNPHPEFSNSTSLTVDEAEVLATGHSPAREEAYTKFITDMKTTRRAEAAFAASPQQIYFLIDNKPYISIGAGYMSSDGPVNLVLMDGKRMTGAEVNKAYTRQQLSGDGEALDAKTAKKLYGIDEEVFVLHTKAKP
jgi:hypothetical protein